MRTWLPCFAWCEKMSCLDDGEMEGVELSVMWRGWRLEVSIVRRTRTLHAD